VAYDDVLAQARRRGNRQTIAWALYCGARSRAALRAARAPSRPVASAHPSLDSEMDEESEPDSIAGPRVVVARSLSDEAALAGEARADERDVSASEIVLALRTPAEQISVIATTGRPCDSGVENVQRLLESDFTGTLLFTEEWIPRALRARLARLERRGEAIELWRLEMPWKPEDPPAHRTVVAMSIHATGSHARGRCIRGAPTAEATAAAR
jgi:hypothetical protein